VSVVRVLGSYTHCLLNIMMRRSPAFSKKKKYANSQFCSTMMIGKDCTVNQYPPEGIHDFA
jgi:hypothetical protein